MCKSMHQDAILYHLRLDFSRSQHMQLYFVEESPIMKALMLLQKIIGAHQSIVISKRKLIQIFL
jgi:hypothetical protein